MILTYMLEKDVTIILELDEKHNEIIFRLIA